MKTSSLSQNGYDGMTDDTPSPGHFLPRFFFWLASCRFAQCPGRTILADFLVPVVVPVQDEVTIWLQAVFGGLSALRQPVLGVEHLALGCSTLERITSE